MRLPRLARISTAIEARAAAWARRRQGLDHPPFDLRARRIYILPTRSGVGFAVLLAVMLIAGLNYANSLALFLAFLLGAFALVGLHQCHRGLLGLTVAAVHGESACAGDTARVHIRLQNGTSRLLAGLALTLAMRTRTTEDSLTLGAGESAQQWLLVPTTRRGLQPLPRVHLSTQQPFGLFRSWSWLHVPLQIVVYPRPAGALPPPAALGEHLGSLLHGPGEDELADLRAFRAGDSPRQVAWKAYARGAPLLVKEYRAAGAQGRRFVFAALNGLDVETRLSQLARWVLDAEARGEQYALEMPQLQIAEGNGRAHCERCLTALALHGLPPATRGATS